MLDWGADPTLGNVIGKSTLTLLKRDRNSGKRRVQAPVTEHDILEEIKEIWKNKGGFTDYLKDLKPQYELSRIIDRLVMWV